MTDQKESEDMRAAVSGSKEDVWSWSSSESDDDESEDDEIVENSRRDKEAVQFVLSPQSVAIRNNARRLLMLSSTASTAVAASSSSSRNHHSIMGHSQPQTIRQAQNTQQKQQQNPLTPNQRKLTLKQKQDTNQRRKPLSSIEYDRNIKNIIPTRDNDGACKSNILPLMVDSNGSGSNSNIHRNKMENITTSNRHPSLPHHHHENEESLDITKEIESDIREIQQGLTNIASMAISASESVLNCAVSNVEVWTDRTWNAFMGL